MARARPVSTPRLNAFFSLPVWAVFQALLWFQFLFARLRRLSWLTRLGLRQTVRFYGKMATSDKPTRRPMWRQHA